MENSKNGKILKTDIMTVCRLPVYCLFLELTKDFSADFAVSGVGADKFGQLIDGFLACLLYTSDAADE